MVDADVLVIPRRVIPRFADLTPAEVSSSLPGLGEAGRTKGRPGLNRAWYSLAFQVTDLFASAQLIGKVVEEHYSGQ